MSSLPAHKYRPFPPIQLPERTWPSTTIKRAPAWCSVDLRDGNQALVEPMGHERKRRMFELLIKLGFKEIEVGFPSASQTDYDFLRWLIEEQRIPGDVTIQVLTQAREHLIRKTFDALRGARRAVVHMYNSTSTLQRDVVFRKDRRGVVDIAVEGTSLLRRIASQYEGTEIAFEYSPESFTGTELDFAKEICESVMEAWGANENAPMILNLPSTVEMATPNVYADQIEWFARNVAGRGCYILSVHPHNDRGTAVAAAELAMMAGADRVEGTLFGNGERTGNVDIVTLGLNLLTQGVDPQLELGNMNEIVEVAEYANRLPIHPRHPYAGELVFTAFSGSHQDAIKKGLSARAERGQEQWEVPYLPIDPEDLGRSYEAVIRINSQSGKGGVAYILEAEYGLVLPRAMQVEFSQVVQRMTDESGKELSPAEIHAAFEREYLTPETQAIQLGENNVELKAQGQQRELSTTLLVEGRSRRVSGVGNGPIDAFVDGLKRACDVDVDVVSYSEHSVGRGANAQAVAYVQITMDGHTSFGVGKDSSILTASVGAVLSAVGRLRRQARS